MEEIINKYPTIIVDVRSEQEFKEGHINGAINIPLYKVKSDFQKKVKNKNEYIVLYCTSGIRSKKAQNILISMGYTNVYNLISEFY
ncbi:rhodanese domain-containing protein [Clostridium sp. CAG:492]|nr:rhodanese domain-containing protein [Clostridium sp. CAG:492]